MPFTWPIAIALVRGAVWGAALAQTRASPGRRWRRHGCWPPIGLMSRQHARGRRRVGRRLFRIELLGAADAQARALDSPLRRMARAGRGLTFAIRRRSCSRAGCETMRRRRRMGRRSFSRWSASMVRHRRMTAALGAVSVSVTGTLAKDRLRSGRAVAGSGRRSPSAGRCRFVIRACRIRTSRWHAAASLCSGRSRAGHWSRRWAAHLLGPKRERRCGVEIRHR